MVVAENLENAETWKEASIFLPNFISIHLSLRAALKHSK